MRTTLKRLLQMTAGYGMVQWAGPFISFILSPILTRILAPSDYGVNEYVMTVASGACALALFGLPQAMQTHYNDHADKAWQRSLIGSILALSTLISLPYAAGLIFLAPRLAQSSFRNMQHTLLFQLTGATLICSAINGVLVIAAKSALRVRWGMAFSMTTLLTTTLGNILFIVILRWGVLGMILVQLCSGLVLSVTAILTMRPMIGAPQFSIMGKLLKAGVVLAPAAIASWALQMVDRLFLVHYVSARELGYYAFANRIAAMLYVLMAPIYSSWTPLALALQNEPNAKQQYADVARYIMAASLCGSLFLGLFAIEILIVMTRAPYLPAAPYVGYLSYAYVFSALAVILNTGAMAGKHLSSISWSVFIGALTNIILNGALIPSFGVWGATIATVVSFAVQPVLLYSLVQKRYRIPYLTERFLGVLAVQICLMIIGTTLPPIIFGIRIPLKLGLFAILPLSFVQFGLITRAELHQAVLFVRNQLRPKSFSNK